MKRQVKVKRKNRTTESGKKDRKHKGIWKKWGQQWRRNTKDWKRKKSLGKNRNKGSPGDVKERGRSEEPADGG